MEFSKKDAAELIEATAQRLQHLSFREISDIPSVVQKIVEIKLETKVVQFRPIPHLKRILSIRVQLNLMKGDVSDKHQLIAIFTKKFNELCKSVHPFILA
jgi:hypothetical protein